MLKSNYYISRPHNWIPEPVVRFIILGLLSLMTIIIFHKPINQRPLPSSQRNLTTTNHSSAAGGFRVHGAAATQLTSVAGNLAREQAIKTIISDGRNIVSSAYGQNNQISPVARQIRAANRPYFFITQE